MAHDVPHVLEQLNAHELAQETPHDIPQSPLQEDWHCSLQPPRQLPRQLPLQLPRQAPMHLPLHPVAGGSLLAGKIRRGVANKASAGSTFIAHFLKNCLLVSNLFMLFYLELPEQSPLHEYEQSPLHEFWQL